MKYKVLADYPVAVDSRDHLEVAGTACDNSVNMAFNRKLYPLFDGSIRLVDMGCSGGGFVKTMLDDGHDAIGLEGSDYSLLRQRAEWATIPDNLFTCDITRPFRVFRVTDEGDSLAIFDVVTAWEVMEHIPEERLPQLIENVLVHLAPTGLWIMSVSTQRGYHHVTVRQKRWWLELFSRHGLKHDQGLVEHFGDDWIRGPNQGAPESFHLILRRG